MLNEKLNPKEIYLTVSSLSSAYKANLTIMYVMKKFKNNIIKLVAVKLQC